MQSKVLIGIAAGILVFQGASGIAQAQQRSPIREAAARVRLVQPAPPAENDSGANGAAIGALIGGGVMGTYLAIAWNRCGAGCENDLPGWAPFAAVGVGAGGGAAVGYLIDKAYRGKRKLAVAPAVSRKSRGVRVAVRF